MINHPEQSTVLSTMQRKLIDWQNEISDYGMKEDSKELIEAFASYKIESNRKYRERIEARENEVRQAILNE